MSKKKLEDKKPTAYVVDTTTGEITENIYEGDKVVHLNDEIEKENQYVYINKKKGFIKLFDDTTRKLLEVLSYAEFAFTLGLSELVCYDDAIIRHGGHGNGKVLTSTDISEELHMDVTVVRKYIAKLNKLGIINVTKVGCKDKPNVMIKVIIVNPYIFMRGNKINKTVVTIFEKSGWND